jgi:hypothetical protein
VSLFQSQSLVLRTSTAGVWEKGKFIPGAMTDTPFKSSVQPPSGKALQTLPEGQRSSDLITVYPPINCDITPSDPLLGRTGDIIVWEGREYEVIQAQKWHNGLIPHWTVIAQRKKEGRA